MVTPPIAHVIANGPSAKQAVIPRAEDAVRIGVNTVGIVQPDLDWLCFGDTVMWEIMHGRNIEPPRRGYIIPAREARNGADFPGFKGKQVLPWEWLWLPEDLGYSACIAIWAARTMRATEIHLWGFDYAGDAYADGTPVAYYQGATHWDRELRYFAKACAFVHRDGVRIVRH